MNERLTQIFELPMPHKIGILVGTFVLLFGSFWYFFYSSLSEEMSKLTEAIDGQQGLRVQIVQQEGLRKNLKKFTADVLLLNAELKKALSELPDKKEIDQLLARVSDKARDAGLDIKLFKPKPEERKDFYAAVPVDIEVSGSYHQVATFFDEVGHLERIVNLNGLAISDPNIGEETTTLKTSVIATAFRFLDESERIKGSGDAKGAKKKRGKKTEQ